MSTQPETRRPRLLAVDESMQIHRMLKVQLRGERLEIHCATDGAVAAETARNLKPEVILLNIDLPEANGFAILSELKSDPATHDIPVIFLSSLNDTAAKIRGLELGALDFVTKPYDLGELKARVRSAVRISQLIQMLAQRAQIDGLTGLWNRAHFDHSLRDEIRVADRHGTPLALILCDLDRFKTVNDTFGHPFGDQVLEEFARILGDGRSGETACRYGGEEFAVIVPRATAADAVALANRFRRSLNERSWVTAGDFVVTASFGVTDLTLALERTVHSMVHSADQALYAAKQAGRNCVMIAPDPRWNVRMTA